MRSSDWARGGLWRAPRIRAEDPSDPSPGGLSSTEQFFNVCFCAAFGVAKVDRYLINNQDVGSFLAYFFSWWMTWIIGSEYAARYNNVDFSHKIFWTMYGVGVVGMLMHTGGGISGPNGSMFCASAACVCACVATMTLRLAFYVERARFSGLWHGGFLVLAMIAWLAAAATPPSSNARRFWWAVACLVEPLTSGCFLLFFQSHLVPISQAYQVNKFATICVLALGAFVASATGGVDPSSWPVDDRSSVRCACGLGFMLFINLKFMICDVDTVAVENHAVARGPEYRCAWRLLQPLLIMTLVAAAAGLDGLLTATPPGPVTGGFYGRVGGSGAGDDTDDDTAGSNQAGDSKTTGTEFARRLAYFSTAGVLVTLAFQRKFLTLPAQHMQDSPQLLEQRSFKTRAELAAAVALILTPFALPRSRLPLHVRDIAVLAATATLLVVMHLILKQRELQIIDDDEAALASSGAVLRVLKAGAAAEYEKDEASALMQSRGSTRSTRPDESGIAAHTTKAPRT